VHTEYSLLDGACRVEEVAKAAAQFGLAGVALTDHGVLYGTIPFYKACQSAGVKPLIGCEVYVAPRTRFDREGKVDANLRHLLLLAENETGYRNLMALVSDANIEGFYYKPRVDRELLEPYCDGLIGLSACLSGEVPALILQDREDEARELAGQYRDLFGPGNFYFELQQNGIPEQDRVNGELLRMAADLGIDLVATNDVHYTRREDARTHDVLLCVQTNATVDDSDRLRFATDQFYLRSPEEMQQLFGEHPQALANTVAIAERCQVELSFGDAVLPDFEVPKGQTADSYLRQSCFERLPERYPDAPDAVKERLEYELDVIRQRGLSTYVLITWDIMRFAREQGILVGPGRGSAPGSVTLYLLGVTGVDPLALRIPFERFINPERLSMPDVDMDFEDVRRDEVIRYITDKYGSEHVAQIITFGTMGPRLAARDAGRAMNVPIAEVDRIAKQIDAARPIAQSVESNPDLRREYEENATVRKLLDTAMGIEGLARHASTHAAGVVISKEPLKRVVPLQQSTEGDGVTTQFDMDAVTDVGLLKLDVLGLRTLSVFRRALELIELSRGEQIDLDAIPLDDAATFDLLGRGETAGVFQLESAGMRQVVTELRPDRLDDIIALVALYRPGPMARIPEYIGGKHGSREITYLHPRLEPILEETYGVIVYQEHVMEIARALAGFSMGAADTLLNAMRKKKRDDMATLRVDFLEGAERNSIPHATAERIFDQMADFAGYGFNKAHSASYAINAYQTAYLKTHYPAEFMAAQLTSIMDDKDKVASYVQECRRMGIEVLAPDVNASQVGFSVEEGKVRFGLAAVKHVSRIAVDAISAGRAADGPFVDVYELCSRLEPGKLNKLALESLARAGALSSLPGSRAQHVAAMDQALEWGARVYRDRQTGQASLFASPEGGGMMQPPSPPLPAAAEFPQSELLAMERDRLGAYLSGHPLSAVNARLSSITTATLSDVTEGVAADEVVVGGIIAATRKRVTRTGRLMAFFTLEDASGVAEATLLPDAYEKFGASLTEQAIVVVRGRVELDDRWREERESGGRRRLLAEHMALLEDEEAVTQLRYAAPPTNSRNGRNGRSARNGGAGPNGQPVGNGQPGRNGQPVGNGQPGRNGQPVGNGQPGRNGQPVGNGRARREAVASEGAAVPAAAASEGTLEGRGRVHIRVPDRAAPAAVGRLKEVLGQFHGDTEVLLHIGLGEGERRVRLGPDYAVASGEGFTAAVQRLLGDDAVWLE
jgi:DNA polymerase-3 subunit alpha